MADLILPDPRFEMPELFVPGVKPYGRVVETDDRVIARYMMQPSHNVHSDLIGLHGDFSINGTKDLEIGGTEQAFFVFDGTVNNYLSETINRFNPAEGTFVHRIKRTFADTIGTEQTSAFLGYRNGGNYIKFKFDDNDDLWHYYLIRSFTVNDITFAASIIPQNQWATVALRWGESSDEAAVFVDGKKTVSTTGIGTYSGTPTTWRVGGGDIVESRGWTGNISAHVYYNQCLSDAEMSVVSRNIYSSLIPE